MVDRALRPLKARFFAPLTAALVGVPADAVTALGLAVGVAAALLAAAGRFDLALLAWLLNRLLDGLDGELARAARRAGASADAGRAPTDARGAYLDLMADLVVYAAVPLGLAAGATGSWSGDPVATLGGPTAVWIAAAATVAAFYVNLGSWALLSALLPAPANGAAPDPQGPGVRIPSGLVEGAETIVLVSVGLLWPAGAAVTLGATALLTLASAAQRTWWGARRLSGGAGS